MLTLTDTTHLDMKGKKVINLKEPFAQSDGATKGYVDNIVEISHHHL